jgi:hypothetical protein
LFCIPRSEYNHPRYLYVVVPILFALLGMELGEWLCRRRLGAVIAGMLLAGFVIANAFPIRTFLRIGCGDYVGAAAFMFSQTNGRDVIVGVDNHPKSTLMVLEYYDQYHMRSAHRLLTLHGEDWGPQWPQWLVAEQDYGPFVKTLNGAPFVWRGQFLTGAVASGITWRIYEAQSGRAFVAAENLQELGR